jgi:hypothetical protein
VSWGEIIGTALGSLTAVAFAYLLSQAIYRFIALAKEQAAIRAGFRKLSEIYGDVCEPPEEMRTSGKMLPSGGMAGETRRPSDTRTHGRGI